MKRKKPTGSNNIHPGPGEPIRYEQTSPGLQGVLITGQCSQKNLRGISSGIPLKEQIAGTIFEVPESPVDTNQTTLWDTEPAGEKPSDPS
jgi:hypothetical protein